MLTKLFLQIAYTGIEQMQYTARIFSQFTSLATAKNAKTPDCSALAGNFAGRLTAPRAFLGVNNGK